MIVLILLKFRKYYRSLRFFEPEFLNLGCKAESLGELLKNTRGPSLEILTQLLWGGAWASMSLKASWGENHSIPLAVEFKGHGVPPSPSPDLTYVGTVVYTSHMTTPVPSFVTTITGMCVYMSLGLALCRHVTFSWSFQVFQGRTPVWKWPYCLVKWLLDVFEMGQKVGSYPALSISFFVCREPLKLSNYISGILPQTIMKCVQMNAWMAYPGPVLSCLYLFIF